MVCELAALRCDLPMADLRLEHQRFLALDGNNLIAAPPPAQDGTLALGRGERVRLRFGLKPDWPSGAWRIELALSATVAGADGKTLFSGGLVSAPSELRIAEHR